jgi:mycofactocin system glycosyltransferase
LASAATKLLESRTLTVTDTVSRTLGERLLATDIALPIPPQAPRAEITVVIPVLNRSKALSRALGALGTDLPVLVVDDGSSDPAEIENIAAAHGADCMHLPTNRGPAAARNAGLAHVGTPLVAFVDSDVEVGSADLIRLASHFADDRVAVVAPRVVGSVTSRNPRWFERYDAATSSLDMGIRSGLVRPGSAIPFVPSACLVARVSALGVGPTRGFDAGLRLGEDVDLIWRLIGAGHHVRYDPSVVARHEVRSTSSAWISRKFAYGTSAAALSERHPSAVAPAVLDPAVAAAGVALLLRRPWSGPLAVALMVRTWLRLRRQVPDRVTAATTTAHALGSSVRQESALLMRHWWPITMCLMPFSRTVRRAVVSAWLVETSVGLRLGLSPAEAALIRRLDDAAYGAGLWWGAVRHRTLAPLLPRRPRRP